MSDHIVQVSDVLGGGLAPSFFTPDRVVTTYVGPVDVIPGAIAWWGLRAASAATVGTNAIRLRKDDAGNTEQDFATISGGGLDLSSISSFKGANNLFVVKIYDQIGSNHHTQAAAAGQPTFTLSALGTLPSIDNSAGGLTKRLVSSSFTQSQAFTASHVCKYTSDNDGFLWSSASDTTRGPRCNGLGVGTIDIYAGGSDNFTAVSKNVWHALATIYNDTLSDINVDGTANAAVNPGTNGFSAQSMTLLNFTGSNIPWTGYFMEMGIWPFAFSGANSTATSSNQQAYYGY